MSWSGLFLLTNIVAFAGWAALAFLPRGPRVQSIILFGCVGMLCLAYAMMFIGLFGGLADPVRVPGAGEPDLMDYSIPGLRALFMSDGGIVLGWTHYLAFDLFTGLWISRDADAKDFSRLVQLPVLFLTLMAGPIGLLVWLIVREPRARQAARERR
jgi:hypothetical protein